MLLLDRTTQTTAWNLACDEVLLHWSEVSDGPEVLRFWEASDKAVVMGMAGRAGEEVNQGACRDQGIPILRRCSGGGTVLQGPGCLNYALILDLDHRSEAATVGSTNSWVMRRHASVFSELLGREVTQEGVSDLVVSGRKFSGNAQRRRRSRALFHGTVLLDFDLGLISSLLPLPARRPRYRRDRPHEEFIANTYLSAEQVSQALSRVWLAQGKLESPPLQELEDLLQSKYNQDDWNLRR